MTERERMLAGELYRSDDPELVEARRRARRLLVEYAGTLGEDAARRAEILRELLGRVGEGAYVEPPFHCDYGTHIELGDRAYLNANCVVLDCAAVVVGAGTLFGPAVHVYAATHPTDPALRRDGLEYAAPVTIGANVWIGGGAIVGPGVTIGDDAVIGAGSVVTRDVPPGVVAVGNPCRVVRALERGA